MDLADIASALATRYSSGSLTAPTGYTTVQSSTHLLAEGGGKTPFVRILFDGLHDVELPVGRRRKGIARFIVRFHVDQASSLENVTTALYAWHDVLLDRTVGQLQLGEGATSNAVTGAYVSGTRFGLTTLGGAEYAVIELTVDVSFNHSVSAAA